MGRASIDRGTEATLVLTVPCSHRIVIPGFNGSEFQLQRSHAQSGAPGDRSKATPNSTQTTMIQRNTALPAWILT